MGMQKGPDGRLHARATCRAAAMRSSAEVSRSRKRPRTPRWSRRPRQPSRRPSAPGEQLGEAYRRCCTSVSWVGEALAARMLGAKDTWNHPAFFDYVDRWMTEDDTQAVADIKTQSGFGYSSSWERQGQTASWLQGEFPQYSFVDDMWKAYRN